MKGYIGSANIDTNSRLCMASTVAGQKRAFGEDVVPACYEDLQLAEDSELPQYYEHPLAPDTQEEIVVRLDDGATLTVPNVGQHRYEAGQRVRVVVGSHGAFVL